VMPEHQDSQEAQASQVLMASQEHRDQRAHQDHQEAQEMMVPQASQDSLASRVMRERRASVPSTAPSTVVCSSRTDRAAKRHNDEKQLNRQTTVTFLTFIGNKFLNGLIFAITAMNAVASPFSGQNISKE